MATNEIKLKVVADAEYAELDTLEQKIDKLKYQKLQAKLETKTAELEETRTKIENVKSELQKLEGNVDVNDAEVDALKAELNTLQNKEIDLQLDIENSKLEKVKTEIEHLDDDEVELQLKTQSAMEALDQVGQGFDRLKQGASEVGQQIGTLLESAGKQETNKAFLDHAIGNAEIANQKMEQINETVQKLPGDDSIMQGLLSQAVAQDASLTADELERMGVASADYFSAMAYYGKPASEAFQDMNNYLLTGNTAELERSPILANHIDKLKEATTIQERSQILQEALNEEHWGGMSQQDTYNNKLETFNGMLERGRYNLGGIFQEGAKSAMDFIMQLDESTNGIVGMSLALGQMAMPLTDMFMGIGQIGMGLSTLKDGWDVVRDKLGPVIEKFGTLKSKVLETATSIKTTFLSAVTRVGNFMKFQLIPALKNTALGLLETGKSALTAGANALRSAGMWMVEKAQLVASSIASGIATVKNWALAISEWAVASPIYIIIIAIVALIAVLGYLYFNNEQVRQAIDGLGQSLMQVGQIMYTAIVGAVNWVIGALQNLWNYVLTLGGLLPSNVSLTGNQIVDTILRVLMFIATLPLQIGMVFTNIIAKALGFGNNFVQNLINAGSRAVTNFLNQISKLPSEVMAEFNEIINNALNFAGNIGNILWQAGINAITGFLGGLDRHSPGIMQRELIAEITEMGERVPTESKKLISNVGNLGSDIVNEFGNPTLSMGIDENINGNITGENATGYGNQTININLEVGSVDNEERVQEIIDIIRRELSWNNKTAGRSV